MGPILISLFFPPPVLLSRIASWRIVTAVIVFQQRNGGDIGFFFFPCELPTRPEGTRKALMIYIYNPKLTWNAGYLGDLCHQFEWLRVFLMRSGWLHMPLSDNGALSGS